MILIATQAARRLVHLLLCQRLPCPLLRPPTRLRTCLLSTHATTVPTAATRAARNARRRYPWVCENSLQMTAGLSALAWRDSLQMQRALQAALPPSPPQHHHQMFRPWSQLLTPQQSRLQSLQQSPRQRLRTCRLSTHATTAPTAATRAARNVQRQRNQATQATRVLRMTVTITLACAWRAL